MWDLIKFAIGEMRTDLRWAVSRWQNTFFTIIAPKWAKIVKEKESEEKEYQNLRNEVCGWYVPKATPWAQPGYEGYPEDHSV
jgi:hypothetical protein